MISAASSAGIAGGTGSIAAAPHTRADRRRGVGRARDELVGDLFGAEARELLAQRRQVAYGDARGEIDDPVGEVSETRPGVSAALADAFPGQLCGPVPDHRSPPPGGGRGTVSRHREFSPVTGRFERGRLRGDGSRTGGAPLVVTHALRAVGRPPSPLPRGSGASEVGSSQSRPTPPQSQSRQIG
ncbi:hypothetical protein GCM10020295_20540 [Streptomyces cinereospinus]